MEASQPELTADLLLRAKAGDGPAFEELLAPVLDPAFRLAITMLRDRSAAEDASDYDQAAPVAPDVVFGDSAVGYATVRGGLSRTLDGGLHWSALHTPGA